MRKRSAPKMPLLNYTSDVPADKSISEISKMLAKAGARQIMHDYDDQGNINALSFTLQLEGQPLGFRLPTDWRPVQKILEKAVVKSHVARKWLSSEEHARDVAWRITKDWV